jgi:hypothetical protein
MSIQLRSLAALAVAAVGLGLAPSARAAEPEAREAIPANINDAGISTTRGANLVWLSPDPARRVGKLLVFLPSGGAMNLPTEFEWVGNEGARLGYHTIVLAYRNEVGIAANPPLGCGSDPDPANAPLNCAFSARRELFDGREESTVVNVDRANSIENRLTKVLQHLAAKYPNEGWSEFVDPSGVEPAPRWSQTVIAGHSLGSGQAILIGQLRSVSRVASFSGFTDASHDWIAPGATPLDRYFALSHQRDHFFARTCQGYLALELVSSCPYEHFEAPPPVPDPANPFTPDPTNPFLAENRQLPFGTAQLVTNLDPPLNLPQAFLDPYHPSTTRDGWIPKAADGITPSSKLLNAWRSILGDSDADTFLDQADNCPLLANTDQADADGDATGDPCDDTPRGTTPPVITVPPDMTVDATGPAGAAVGYIATATDDLDPDPPVLCTPAAESVFAIGATTVACSATDAGANTANASFLVTVRGAPEQLARLVVKVGGSPSLAALIGRLDPNRPLQRLAACLTLRAFIALVPYLAPAHAAEWTADANRIRAVLAC